jgi:hypothetical protein
MSIQSYSTVRKLSWATEKHQDLPVDSDSLRPDRECMIGGGLRFACRSPLEEISWGSGVHTDQTRCMHPRVAGALRTQIASQPWAARHKNVTCTQTSP